MSQSGAAEERTADGLFRAGRLTAAIEAATIVVRKSPADVAARVFLAELLVFGGNLERADVILDAAAQVDPATALVVAEFRQLLRADTARHQLRRDGRLPEFLGEPTEAMHHVLAARVALRTGDATTAASEVEAAERVRPRVAGRCNDQVFDDFRDVDDLCIGVFEVLTTTGKYFWIPTERITVIEFHPPRRPRDLAWRRASITVQDGPDGDVYIPVVYGSDDATLADQYRLGRATDWRPAGSQANSVIGDAAACVSGIGQRVFLAGENAIGVMDLSALTFGAG